MNDDLFSVSEDVNSETNFAQYYEDKQVLSENPQSLDLRINDIQSD